MIEFEQKVASTQRRRNLFHIANHARVAVGTKNANARRIFLLDLLEQVPVFVAVAVIVNDPLPIGVRLRKQRVERPMNVLFRVKRRRERAHFLCFDVVADAHDGVGKNIYQQFSLAQQIGHRRIV